MTTGIDVIGDVHGQAGLLVRLLEKLGYVDDGRSWRHPERTVMFIGDLIDRNHGQLEVLEIAKRMVDHGAARIVMGNHEFNAIVWATRHPNEPDAYLRPHSQKNLEQHQAFLDAVGEGSTFHHATIDWFKTIPLWCEVDGARFVHVCWDPTSMEILQPRLGQGNTLTRELLVEAATKDTPAYGAVEHLLKGPELELPKGLEYLDKGGHPRDRARYAWWKNDADTLRAGARIPPGTTTLDKLPYPELPDRPIAQPPTAPYRDTVPLFVGHYWETGTPTLLSHHVACVDYSAGKSGPLVAYRWDGEATLSPDRFVLEHPTTTEISYARIAEALERSNWVPATWLAQPGSRTRCGWPAMFRSNVHALMALRMLYLEQVLKAERLVLEERRLRYDHAWAKFALHCSDMRAVAALIDAGDVQGAATRWNELDQAEVNRVYRVVLGEREPAGPEGTSLKWQAQRHFGLHAVQKSADRTVGRSRDLRNQDHHDAWRRSAGGTCTGCGTPTISHAQRTMLHRTFATPGAGFNVSETYELANGESALLWEVLTIAARGVAEHVTPWSQGGMTDESNLTNACAGCNYARGDMSMDAAGVAAYDRPAVERAAERR